MTRTLGWAALVAVSSIARQQAIAHGHVKDVEDAFARAKDAAATLERIEAQRNAKKLGDNSNRPMPAPVVAAPRAMMKPAGKSAPLDEPSPSELLPGALTAHRGTMSGCSSSPPARSSRRSIASTG